jgi:uncharacterized protein YjbJ (UPF0337 family)
MVFAVWPDKCSQKVRGNGPMNWDQVEGKWKQLTGSVKQQWAKLTDDDLTFISGKKDELIGKVQERYGISREEAQKQADAWSDSLPQDTNLKQRAASGTSTKF